MSIIGWFLDKDLMVRAERILLLVIGVLLVVVGLYAWYASGKIDNLNKDLGKSQQQLETSVDNNKTLEGSLDKQIIASDTKDQITTSLIKGNKEVSNKITKIISDKVVSSSKANLSNDEFSQIQINTLWSTYCELNSTVTKDGKQTNSQCVGQV